MDNLQAVRLMEYDDLERVLIWRNQPDVRRYMYTQHEITMLEHRQWFERVSQDDSRHLLIYQEAEIPLGFVQISEIHRGRVAEWGFYVAPDAQKGVGTRLGKAALHYAFSQLSLHKLCGEALAFNHRSIRFHQKLGFVHEGTLAEQFYDGHQYHDIWCFGYLASNWNAIFQSEENI